MVGKLAYIPTFVVSHVNVAARITFSGTQCCYIFCVFEMLLPNCEYSHDEIESHSNSLSNMYLLVS